MTEQTLSDKQKQHDDITCEQYYDEEDVKDFIKKLKERLFEDRQIAIQDCKWTCGEIKEIIDKLAGDKLI